MRSGPITFLWKREAVLKIGLRYLCVKSVTVVPNFKEMQALHRLNAASGASCASTGGRATPALPNWRRARCARSSAIVKPHKVRYYVGCRDPDFDVKMAGVLDVCREAQSIKTVAAAVLSHMPESQPKRYPPAHATKSGPTSLS